MFDGFFSGINTGAFIPTRTKPRQIGVTMKTWEELAEEERKPYFDKAVEILQDHYTCTRVWSAWSYGTMTQDDFALAAEDDNIVSDTAKMLFDFVMGAASNNSFNLTPPVAGAS